METHENVGHVNVGQTNIFFIQMDDESRWKPIRVRVPSILGRGELADVKMDYESVSGQHAKIVFDNDQFFISDMGSTNGTRINGVKIRHEVLNDGDLVSLGLTNFLVKLTDTMPRLYIPQEGRTIALAMIPFIIGRAGGNHLIISDSSVSNKHASIYDEAGQYIIKDHKSTNGTRVNGRRVNTSPLYDGDTVKVGRFQAIFLEKEMVQDRYCLKFLSGENTGQIMEVPPRLKIGRVQDNDLVIDHTAVSSAHALLYWDNERYWIKDLGSRNGTRVGGVRIKEVPLKHGDEIMIANQSLLFYNMDIPQDKFYLVFLDGERGGGEVELINPPITIGRVSSCKVCIPMKEVSSHHAEIDAKDGNYILRDLHSTNGTFVNGQKIETSPLTHGDEIQIGLQHFMFRNAAKPRPQILQEEKFTLIPVLKNGYGKPIAIKDSCSFGSAPDNDILVQDKHISAKHAVISRDIQGGYILCDCGTASGTRVNGEVIPELHLEHGDEIAIGNKRFIFKSSLQPLQIGEKVVHIPLWFSAAAVAVFLFLFLSLAILSVKWNQPVVEEKGLTEQKKTEKSDQEWLSECDNKIQEQLRQYQYKKAYETAGSYKAKVALVVSQHQIEDKQKRLQKYQEFFQKLVDHLKSSSKDISVNLVNQGVCILQKDKISEQNLWVQPSNNMPPVQINWQEIPTPVFFDMVIQSGLSDAKPYETAQLAIDTGYIQGIEILFVQALAKNETPAKEIYSLYIAKVLKNQTKPEELTVYQGKIMTLEQKKALEKEEADKLALQREEEAKAKAEQARIEAEKAEKEAIEKAKSREKEEFRYRFAVIDEFVRTYSYTKAIVKFTALEQETFDSQLKQRIQKRVEQIKPLATLMEKLIKAINDKKLVNSDVKFGENLTGILDWANEDEFKVTIPQGNVKHKWYNLHPREMYNFYTRMKLKSKDLYYTGVFCFDNDLLDEGNQAFVKLLSDYPKSKDMVNQYLAEKLGIPIPEGGFVPYEGRLVSPDEKQKRSQGLVKYRGQWVTGEEKTKLEAGFVKFQGKWVTSDEKKLIALGYRKYKDKYYTPEDLAKLRSNWEDAWECTTTHYDIKSNMTEDFTKQLGIFMESAFKEYERIFSRTTGNRMTIYAFRTYEDYRTYCLKTGNASSLRAGGFASSANNTGVGWRRDDDESLLGTMIHESAHLFHYNVCPSLKMPSWFYEAVATQFEGYTWDGKAVKVNCISPMRLPWLQRKFKENHYIAITDLVKGKALEFINRDPEEASTFYAECWGIYYYLSNAADKKYKDQFLVFVNKMNSGEYADNNEECFLQAFSGEIPTIEEAWKKHIVSMK